MALFFDSNIRASYIKIIENIYIKVLQFSPF